MTIAVDQSWGFFGSNVSSGDVTLTGAATAAGAAIVVVTTLRAGGATVTITDSAGNSYVQACVETSGADSLVIAVALDAAPATWVRAVWSAAAGTHLWAASYTGTDLAVADTAVALEPSGSSWPAATVTPAAAGDLILGAVCLHNSTRNVAAAAPYTVAGNRAASTLRTAIATLSAPTTAATGPAWSLTAGTSIEASLATIALTEATGGTTKTAAASIALDLTPAGAATKTASTGAALALDLATGSDPAKTGQATAVLAALLDLDSHAAKIGRSATSLSVLLGLDTSTTTQAAAAAGIDLNLHMAAAAGLPPEHRTAAATLGLTLALDAAAGKTAGADATLGLTLTSAGDATKIGVAHVDLSLILDALAHAAKTGGAQAVLDLALAVAAAHHTPAGAAPPERTVRIAADDRTITITAQDRTIRIGRQDRTITIQEA